MVRRTARVKMSMEVLMNLLGAPDGTQIYQAKIDWLSNSIEFVMSHPDLPKLYEGMVPMIVTPTITENDDGTREWDWNLD